MSPVGVVCALLLFLLVGGIVALFVWMGRTVA